MTTGQNTPGIRVGIIGLGFMGRTHWAAYQAAARAGHACAIVAAADAMIEKIGAPAGGNMNTGAAALDFTGIDKHQHPADLLARTDVDLVSICTPTDTHVELALAALKAGKHVLLEKPVALDPADVRRIDAAAKAAGRLCMPAMVMRFWPGWTWLRDRINDGSLGKLKSLYLERLGSRPAWNPGFYADDRKSGGALVDLHIHDADFVLWCLGKPASVSSTGSLEQVTTSYRYSDNPRLAPGATVLATGGWGQNSSFGFRMRYLANFEHATAEFDLARGEKPVNISDAHGTRAVELPAVGGYDAEVRHVLDAIAGRTPLAATLEDAALVAELLMAERAQLGV